MEQRELLVVHCGVRGFVESCINKVLLRVIKLPLWGRRGGEKNFTLFTRRSKTQNIFSLSVCFFLSSLYSSEEKQTEFHHSVHAKEEEQQRALFRFCRCCQSCFEYLFRRKSKSRSTTTAISFCNIIVVVCKVFRDGASSSYKRIRFDDDTRNNDRAEQQQEQQQTQFPKKNALRRNSFNIIATTSWLRRSRRRRQRESLATRKRGVL